MFTTLKKIALATLFMASAVQVQAAAVANPVPAPEFAGIEKWLNSEPLTVASLRGKVVLVDFWTYTCINCIHTLPYVKTWYQKYKDQGLAVVGVHTPEFPFERSTKNVVDAAKRLGVEFPIAQDNRYTTWEAYKNSYWPAFYLIDKQGKIVYTHFGEGRYAETEAEIQRLLAQP
jgi:thiol-disulfide isomerase/thioredoxin